MEQQMTVISMVVFVSCVWINRNPLVFFTVTGTSHLLESVPHAFCVHTAFIVVYAILVPSKSTCQRKVDVPSVAERLIAF